MNAPELLSDLRARGIVVRTDGHRISCKPPSALTGEIRALVEAHKRGLIELLLAEREDAIYRLFGPTAVLTGGVVETGPGTACYACQGKSWWRLRGSSHWICPRCHPPQAEPDEIEVRDA